MEEIEEIAHTKPVVVLVDELNARRNQEMLHKNVYTASVSFMGRVSSRKLIMQLLD